MAVLLGTNGNNVSTDFAVTNDSDTVYALDGTDTVKGAGGNDYLYGGQGNDDLDGQTGGDYLEAGDGNDEARGGNDDDEVYGGRGNDKLGDDPAVLGSSEQGNDLLDGGSGDDQIGGGDGDDEIFGGSGSDKIGGGNGKDTMWGGSGPDTFVWTDILQTGNSGATADWVKDFNRGEGDIIDLSAIDAKPKPGNQDFKFIGQQKFHDKPGELRYKNGKIEGDVDGDGVKDFVIKVSGAGQKMFADDFDL